MPEASPLFSIVDDAHVITRKRGSYRQAKLYLRHGKPYVGNGSIFMSLMNHGVTSDPDMKWVEIIGAPDSVKLIAP